jgi:hypothetical protein
MVCVQVLDYEKPGAITALCKSLQKRVEEAELKGGEIESTCWSERNLKGQTS